MWLEIKWVANLKLVLEMMLAIATVAIAFFSLQVYRNQLKIMEYDNSPKFKIDVSAEVTDNICERYIRISNLGDPIKTKVDTEAIMTVQLQDGKRDTSVNIRLNGYFYETDDNIANGTSMTGELCKRSTNFCDSYIRGAMNNARLKLNQMFIKKKIPVYNDIFYLVKIGYKNHMGKEENKYYLVGNFQNQEIAESDYKQFLNTQYVLDVGDYLNSPVDDEIMRIITKVLANKS